MNSNYLLPEEPIRMALILEPSKPSFLSGHSGFKSRTAEIILACLNAGMSVARFDFSFGNAEYHQETLENLREAFKSTMKLCEVMLDTLMGPELHVVNTTGHPISLEADTLVFLTPDQDKKPLPICFQ